MFTSKCNLCVGGPQSSDWPLFLGNNLKALEMCDVYVRSKLYSNALINVT